MTRLATAVVFLHLVVLFATAPAQSPEKIPRIGFLGSTTRSPSTGVVDAFLDGLRDLGWVEGSRPVS